MLINVKDLLYYGEDYPWIKRDYDYIWWLCKIDNSIMRTDELVDQYSYNS